MFGSDNELAVIILYHAPRYFTEPYKSALADGALRILCTYRCQIPSGHYVVRSVGFNWFEIHKVDVLPNGRYVFCYRRQNFFLESTNRFETTRPPNMNGGGVNQYVKISVKHELFLLKQVKNPRIPR